MKEELRGKLYGGEELKTAVRKWLHQWPEFHKAGINALICRWNTDIEIEDHKGARKCREPQLPMFWSGGIIHRKRKRLFCSFK